MTELSRATGRQIGLLIDRRGRIEKGVLGDAHQLFIPELGRSRGASARFRGLRLVHTHLRSEPLSQDDLTDLSLLRLDVVVVVQAGLDGLPGQVQWAHLLPPGTSEEMWRVEDRSSVHQWDENYLQFITDLENQFGRQERLRRVPGQENAVLLSVQTRNNPDAASSLAELKRLADTAGLHVVDSVLQRRRQIDGRTVIGKGKLESVLLRAMHLGAEVLVFDQDLSPSQLRNVATATDLKVLDRTQLILDIFAQRATTREGKLQVEIAQLRYRRPRLALMPTAMSRLTGGIGGRGPGETKLEIGKRRSGERLTRLEKQLSKLAKNRDMRRQRRKRVGLPLVSIVGYTNAGKSTLLNRLTNSSVDAEDKLFATLDPTSRRLRFPEEREIILTDTVGFIRRLPDDLVQAFRATLEEVVQADLILHVLDAADPDFDLHKDAVDEVLSSLGAEETPTLTVLNKIDAVPASEWADLKNQHDGILLSAHTGEGAEGLLNIIEQRLFETAAQESNFPGQSGTD